VKYFRLLLLLGFLLPALARAVESKPNVLFLISDDLTYTALSCYGNKVCQTLVSDHCPIFSVVPVPVGQ